MRSAARVAMLVLVGFAAGSAGAIGCDGGDECSAGSERCPCTADNRCLQGLICLSGYCVDPGSASGGGNDGSDIDNVAACEAWADGVSCGDANVSDYIDCNMYANLSCDVSDYFDCLTDVTMCTDGVLDNARWPECVELASCA